MKTPKLFQHALINSLLTALYVSVVACLMYYGPQKSGQINSVLLPIAMLSLFVLSAAIVGLLIFGRPVYWYLNGQKQEAVKLTFLTVGIFSLITITFLLLLVLIAHR